MKTLYVPLDEVILLLHTNFPLLEQERTLRNALKDIEYLPTIDLSVIDKMIEEYQHCPGEEGFYGLGILGELKSRLSTNL